MQLHRESLVTLGTEALGRVDGGLYTQGHYTCYCTVTKPKCHTELKL